MRIAYAIGFIISSYLYYKYNQKRTQYILRIISSNLKLSKFLLNEKILEDYSPTFFGLFSGHAHTFLLQLYKIFFEYLNKLFHYYKFKFHREIFTLSDGGIVAVDHCLTENSKSLKKILLVLPGYSSSSSDHYISGFLDDFVDEFDCRVMNHRGWGGIDLKSAIPCSTYEVMDIKEYVNELSKEGKKIYIVGFSFGGMLLTRYLGKNPDDIPKNVVACSGICYPTHLVACQKHCESQLDGLYSRLIAYDLKDYLLRNYETIYEEAVKKGIIVSPITILEIDYENPISVSDCSGNNNLQKIGTEKTIEITISKEQLFEEIQKVKMVSDFDNVWTYKILGFNSLQDYLNDSDLEKYLHNIKIPYFSVFTEDDPVIPCKDIPVNAYEQNKNLTTIITKTGGHLGFYSGIIPQMWICGPIKSFLKSIELFKFDVDKDETLFQSNKSIITVNKNSGSFQLQRKCFGSTDHLSENKI